MSIRSWGCALGAGDGSLYLFVPSCSMAAFEISSPTPSIDQSFLSPFPGQRLENVAKVCLINWQYYEGSWEYAIHFIAWMYAGSVFLCFSITWTKCRPKWGIRDSSIPGIPDVDQEVTYLSWQVTHWWLVWGRTSAILLMMSEKTLSLFRYWLRKRSHARVHWLQVQLWLLFPK